jgi:hypothetical protein
MSLGPELETDSFREGYRIQNYFLTQTDCRLFVLSETKNAFSLFRHISKPRIDDPTGELLKKADILFPLLLGAFKEASNDLVFSVLGIFY